MIQANRHMVAIVDDDDAARHALQFLLGVLGRHPEGFASASDFLDTDIGRFACLILDQHMPTMTGLELAQRLRSAATQVGIDMVSEKPLEITVLSTFIDDALR
jgi:two-component system response regulator FixJ